MGLMGKSALLLGRQGHSMDRQGSRAQASGLTSTVTLRA